MINGSLIANLIALSTAFDRSVNRIMLGPPTRQYHAQAWDLPDTYEILTHPLMGFSFLKRRDNSVFAEVSFQIKTWRKVVHYAPQPFVDLGHGIGLNTGPAGFAERTDTADQAPRSLIAFKPYFTFHALQNKRSLSLEWPRTPEALSKCPKTSLWYISA